MALQDITNAPAKFRLHVDLDREYATLRTCRIANTQAHLVQLRMQGSKALDLWTDGCLYPIDPLTNAPPSFQNITTLLRFVGNGFNGLLGYCLRLQSIMLHESRRRRDIEVQLEKLQASSSIEINGLREKVTELTKELTKQRLDAEERFSSFVRVTDNYVSLQHSARNMRRRIDHLTHLPIGCGLRKRKRRSVDMLAKKGGALKRRVRATRFVIFF